MPPFRISLLLKPWAVALPIAFVISVFLPVLRQPFMLELQEREQLFALCEQPFNGKVHLQISDGKGENGEQGTRVEVELWYKGSRKRT